MYQGKKKRLRERLFCQFLAASMVLSGITVWPDAREAAFAAEEKIQIESVEDLEKIGNKKATLSFTQIRPSPFA